MKNFLTNTWKTTPVLNREDIIKEKMLVNPYIVATGLDGSKFSEIFSSLGFIFKEFINPVELEDFLHEKQSRVAICISKNTDNKLQSKYPEIIHFYLEDSPSLPAELTLGKMEDLIIAEVANRLDDIYQEMDMLFMFLADTKEFCDQIESKLLEIDEGQAQVAPSFDQILGMTHTIKGTGGFFTPNDISEFSHAFEEDIKESQALDFKNIDERIPIWLKAVDILRIQARELQECTLPATSKEEFIKVFSQEFEITDKKEAQKVEEIKVPLTTLDSFMETSAEMTIIRNLISKTAQMLEERYSGDSDLNNLIEYLDSLDELNSDVQDKVNQLRKVELTALARSLRRTVKESARKLNKDINFVITGEGQEVDYYLVENLTHCLIHMVRNSVDHGVETKDERLATSKNAQAQLQLSFELAQDEIVVKISDDGCGLNLNKIKEVAIERGIRTSQEIAQMSDQEISMLIFAPNFSTNEEVTELSGRGVGMSMVKEVVDEAQGRIEVDSTRGVGTTFKITMPIETSVLIKKSLLVEDGELSFGFSQSEISRIIHLGLTSGYQEELIQGEKFLRNQDKLIPIFSLAKLFSQAKQDTSSSGHYLILNSTEGEVAFSFNEILDLEDAVIRKLQHPFEFNQIIDGVSFLEAGKMSYILNTEALIKYLGVKRIAKSSIKKKELPVKKDASLALRDFLFFTIGQENFAIDSQNVIRVGKIAPEELQVTNEASFWVKDSEFHEIIALDDKLTRTKTINTTAEVTYLQIKDGKKDLFLAITNILDMAQAPSKEQPFLKKRGWMSSFIEFNEKPYIYFAVAAFKKSFVQEDINLKSTPESEQFPHANAS